MEQVVSELLDKVEHLIGGIDTIVGDAQSPVKNALTRVDTILRKLDSMLGQPGEKNAIQHLPETLNGTMREFKATLKILNETAKAYSGDSKFAHELEKTLRTLTETSEAMQRVLDKVEAKPNALIFGE